MAAEVFALTVALEKNIREEDIGSLIRAILHLRGVLGVKAEVADSMMYTIQQRVRIDLHKRILDSLDEKLDAAREV